MSDYYALLGVSRDADADTIKKAYRRLAMESHPDRNQGSPESEARFKEITRAYEVLRDPDQRAAYDRFGEDGVRGAAGAGGGFGGFDFTDALNIFMRDFGGFEDAFGGRQGGGGATAARGRNVRVRLPLTLEEVAAGVTKRIRVSLLEPCDRCEGVGAEPGSGPTTCPTCGGSGQERTVQRSVFGQFMSVIPCRGCGGTGERIENPCTTCRGEGLVRREQEVEVEIPAGVSPENYLTLRGRGNSGERGGPRGDIIVLFEVAEDPRFTRDGQELIHEIGITFAEAALGTEREIPTVEGTERLTVPAGTQSGETIRLRGKGLPDPNGRGSRGDQIVRVLVWTPQRLSREQQELFRRLQAVEDPPPSPGEENGERKGFWTRMKEAIVS